MKIELFGYYLYPAFFITLIGIPLIFAILFISIRKIKEKRAVYSNSVITAWQKKHLVRIIDSNIEKSDSSEFTEILEEAKDFIQTCKYWNNDEMIEINKDMIILLSVIFFEEVKNNYKDNPDKCVLLLNAIDSMNGGVNADLKKHWMDDDFPTIENNEEMTVDETKLLCLCNTAVLRAMTNYINPDTQNIPKLTLAFKDLIGMETEDFGSVSRHILHCQDFRELKNSDYRIIAMCLIDMIDEEFKKLRDDYFEPYYLCYFRALACVLDHNLYDYILDTLE